MKSFIILIILFYMSTETYSQVNSKRLNYLSVNQKAEIEINLQYLLYLPYNYHSTGEKFPLVIFLHGSGERVSDLEKVKIHRPPKLVENGMDFQFILVAPQCPEGKRWTHLLLELSILIDEIQTQYKADRNRIYLTGLSMGGQGTWTLAMYQPKRFAAIAPICGWSDTFEVCKLKNLPIWVFHGAKDQVVPLSYSENIVEALRKCGAEKIKFTIYPDANHDS